MMDTAGALDPAFLGIACSLTGRRWRQRPGDVRAAEAISGRLGLPEVVGRVLAARGVTPEGAADFLNPTLRSLMPDPVCLSGMEEAARRLAQAVMSGETVAVFGDYDVDGATSSALLVRFLRAVGGRAVVYIPDRLTEGYGPNADALMRLKEQGAALAVTVDCGITAFAPLEAAAAAGLPVIVVDHHAAEPRLPVAHSVINPNRLDDTSGLGHMAAVGVAFLLVAAVNRLLRGSGWYGAVRPEPDLMRWLDIVALGTVCDVVPLTGINRAFVAQGLKVLARRENPGLAALAEAAGIKERPGTYHLGFVLGPRVNAGGRVGDCDLGARLLSTDDIEEARAIAARLHALNAERQEIEAAVLYQAMEQVEGHGGAETAALVFAAGDGWHAGVLGLAASRLKERYGRPALVAGLDGVWARGSGRSVAGVDLGAAVIAARQAGLAEAGGGHAMAAGFTVARERLDDFRTFMEERIRGQIAAMGGLDAVLDLDGALDAGGATAELAQTLESSGPFGAGNPQPRFAVAGARVVRADVVGQGHVRCILTGASSGARLKAIAFRAADSDLGVALLNAPKGPPMHLAGTLRPDTWQGRTEAQLVIEDAAMAVTETRQDT